MAFHSNQAIWEPPADLQQSLPRPVRFTGGGLALVIVGTFFVCAALAAGWLIHAQETRYARVEHEGITADGRVTRLWIGTDKSRTPMVSYRFVAGSTEIGGRSSLRLAIWKGLRQGGLLTVRYVALAPQLNHPAEGAPAPLSAWLVGVAVAWPPILFWAILRRQWRLLSWGSPVPATVTEVKRRKNFRVSYDFNLPSGEAMTGKCDRNSVPRAGSRVCVLYDPDKPRRNTLYPLDMVRLRRA
ncbi:MAG TPA: hypothetical protein VHZ74_19175 [Bryobacteraceae bacterium]|nr:hypothetical protein [Bryobacteraceae bacterium]